MVAIGWWACSATCLVDSFAVIHLIISTRVCYYYPMSPEYLQLIFVLFVSEATAQNEPSIWMSFSPVSLYVTTTKQLARFWLNLVSRATLSKLMSGPYQYNITNSFYTWSSNWTF
jgi:hypothetical protein